MNSTTALACFLAFPIALGAYWVMTSHPWHLACHRQGLRYLFRGRVVCGHCVRARRGEPCSACKFRMESAQCAADQAMREASREIQQLKGIPECPDCDRVRCVCAPRREAQQWLAERDLEPPTRTNQPTGEGYPDRVN